MRSIMKINGLKKSLSKNRKHRINLILNFKFIDVTKKKITFRSTVYLKNIFKTFYFDYIFYER